MEEKTTLILGLIPLLILFYFGVKLFIKSALNSSKNSKDTRICTKCGNTTFVPSSKKVSGNILGMRIATSGSEVKICKKCGNEGSFPVIEKQYVEEYIEGLKKSQ